MGSEAAGGGRTDLKPFFAGPEARTRDLVPVRGPPEDPCIPAGKCDNRQPSSLPRFARPPRCRSSSPADWGISGSRPTTACRRRPPSGGRQSARRCPLPGQRPGGFGPRPGPGPRRRFVCHGVPRSAPCPSRCIIRRQTPRGRPPPAPPPVAQGAGQALAQPGQPRG